MRRVVDPNTAELDFLNVRYLMTDPSVAAGGRWKELYRGRDGGLYENPAVRPRFFSETAEVRDIREVRPGEFTMRVRAPAAATVSSSEVVAPGRRVIVNGRRAEVSGAFVTFQVPAGESLIRMDYRPASYWGSVVIAAVAALATAGIRRW